MPIYHPLTPILFILAMAVPSVGLAQGTGAAGSIRKWIREASELQQTIDEIVFLEKQMKVLQEGAAPHDPIDTTGVSELLEPIRAIKDSVNKATRFKGIQQTLISTATKWPQIWPEGKEKDLSGYLKHRSALKKLKQELERILGKPRPRSIAGKCCCCKTKKTPSPSMVFAAGLAGSAQEGSVDDALELGSFFLSTNLASDAFGELIGSLGGTQLKNFLSEDVSVDIFIPRDGVLLSGLSFGLWDGFASSSFGYKLSGFIRSIPENRVRQAVMEADTSVTKYTAIGARIEVFSMKPRALGYRKLASNFVIGFEVTHPRIALKGPGDFLKTLVLADPPRFKDNSSVQFSFYIGYWFWK